MATRNSDTRKTAKKTDQQGRGRAKPPTAEGREPQAGDDKGKSAPPETAGVIIRPPKQPY